VVSEGSRVPIKKVDRSAQIKKNAVFARVVATAKRLVEVVLKNEGIANKDLAKLESQIQSIIDRWDR
jgi:metallo-beta-lactamase family protein